MIQFLLGILVGVIIMGAIAYLAISLEKEEKDVSRNSKEEEN